MINVHIFQTSLRTGNEAKSHTCTMNTRRGRLLGYAPLPGSHKVVVKAKLIPRLLDVWMCSEKWSEITDAHAANV